MRKLVVLAVCVALAGCGWTRRRGGGTNYDPPSDPRVAYEQKRL